VNIYMICTLWTPFQAERDWKHSYREILLIPLYIYILFSMISGSKKNKISSVLLLCLFETRTFLQFLNTQWFLYFKKGLYWVVVWVVGGGERRLGVHFWTVEYYHWLGIASLIIKIFLIQEISVLSLRKRKLVLKLFWGKLKWVFTFFNC